MNETQKDAYQTTGTSPPEDRCESPSFTRCDWLQGRLQRYCPACQTKADAAAARENARHAKLATATRDREAAKAEREAYEARLDQAATRYAKATGSWPTWDEVLAEPLEVWERRATEAERIGVQA